MVPESCVESLVDDHTVVICNAGYTTDAADDC